MKIEIDHAVCQGYANCVMEAEDLFDLDEASGLAVALVAEVPDEGKADAIRAAGSCPVRAIALAGPS